MRPALSTDTSLNVRSGPNADTTPYSRGNVIYDIVSRHADCCEDGKQRIAYSLFVLADWGFGSDFHTGDGKLDRLIHAKDRIDGTLKNICVEVQEYYDGLNKHN